MIQLLNRLRTGFLAAFALAVVAIWSYQIWWVTPERRCEASRNWWDPASRTCGHVVYIPNVTHRPVGTPGAQASLER